MSNLEGMLNVVIGSNVYRAARTAFATAGPYIVEGMVELDGELGEPYLRAERVTGVKFDDG